MAEDCLFAAVYAPANATEQSMLPIMMFISGGGFSSNSNGNFNGTGLVEASGGQMIVIRANYRVGILGFIGGTLVEADSKGAVANNGLNDMIAAARWMQQHATKFGGNPNHIVVSGASSGGNAIDVLLAANNGTGFPDLFAGAIAESPGWGSEGFSTNRDQALTNNLNATGCLNATDPIDCMRMMPIAEFQNKTTKDGWGPTIEGKLIAAPHYQMFEQGRFQNIPVIYGYASDEATPNFISNQTVNTTEEVGASVLKAVGKSMTETELAAVMAAYPESLNSVSVFGRDMNARNASLRQGSGAQWQRDAAIKTELKEHCNAAFLSDIYASVGQAQNYAYRYNILDETAGGNADKGLFSPHVSELYSVWGNKNTDGGDPGCIKLDATDPLSCATGAKIAQAYWISFVRTLNPNTFRLEGSPEWTAWTIAEPNRIVLDNAAASMEKMGAAVGEVSIGEPPMNQRQRCLSLTTNLAKRVNLGLGEGQTMPEFANGTRPDPTLAVMGSSSGAAAMPPVPGGLDSASPASSGSQTTIIIIESHGSGGSNASGGSNTSSGSNSSTGTGNGGSSGGRSGSAGSGVGVLPLGSLNPNGTMNGTRPPPVTTNGAPEMTHGLKSLVAVLVGGLLLTA
ncbi:carboxylesterase [Diaporthe helianthi]|uniref:Carboxylic ester hydrolase n=1 Tax=Diaporthe helianthi TaxID=158607 RepID=A0A2P5I7I6_DIAHE|nr:carboxylesterase [Diaporthe helianthi]